MKKIIIFIGAMIFFTYGHAFAYMMDGNLGDWGDGIAPFIDWRPLNPNIDSVVLDGLRPQYTGGGGDAPWGGEPYDVEALFFDDDPENLYFALVNSYPQYGGLAGDLGIDLDGVPGYEYLVNIMGLNPSSVSQNVDLLKNPQWVGCEHGFANPIYRDGDSGSPAGIAEVFYRDAGLLEGQIKNPSRPATYYNTYILEGRLSRSLFAPITQGQQINLHWSLYCGNDFINLRGDFDTPVIPEPATLSLLGLGLVGLFGFKRRFSS